MNIRPGPRITKLKLGPGLRVLVKQGIIKFNLTTFASNVDKNELHMHWVDRFVVSIEII